MDQLDKLRSQINQIDKSIIEAIANRQKLSAQIGAIKALTNLPVFDPKREEWLKDYHAKLCSENKIPYAFIKELFEVIIDFSRKKQDNKL